MTGIAPGPGIYAQGNPVQKLAVKTAGKYGSKPDPRAVMTPHGWVDPPYTPAENAAAKKKLTPDSAPAKPGKKSGPSAFSKWFNSFTPAKGSAPGSDPFNPLAGMPQQTALTAFPTMDSSTLPDGSEVADSPAKQFAQSKATLLNPNQYADLVGAKSYQPIIDALTSQQNRLGSGVSDANAMMDKSYGDASASSLRGAQIVSDSNQKANQSLTDLAARMAQASGGDPTAAAAVGATSADQQAANSRFAGVAEQAQGDQAAAANRDLATAKLAYKGVTDKSIADLATQSAQAKTEGGQAQGKAIMDALNFNDQAKTDQTGRDVSKQEAWLAGQMAGPQITAGELANDSSRQALALNKHNSAVNDWTTLNSAKRTQYTDAVTKWTNKNVAQQMKTTLAAGKVPGAELALADPTARASMESDVMGSMLSKTGPLVNPAQMYKSALTTMKQEYPDSNPAAIKKLAQIFVNKQIPAWNSGHAAGQKNSGKVWKMVNGAPALVKA